MSNGRFIVFEGGESVGKTTQSRLLEASMQAAGLHVVLSREFSGTAIGKAISPAIKTHMYPGLTIEQEALLFSAARVAFVHEVVQPTLASGHWLIADRYIDSMRAHQGLAGGMSVLWIEKLIKYAGAPAPALTIVLDVPCDLASRRVAHYQDPEGSCPEEKPPEFHQKVRDGFVALAKGQPRTHLLIDGTQDRQRIHAVIIAHLNTRFGLALQPQA